MKLHFQQDPQTFRVDEELFYEPSGSGEHVYLFIEKNAVSTVAAKRLIATQIGIDPRTIKHAGRKDRESTSSQWLSYPRRLTQREPSSCDTIAIRELTYHEHSLALGHVRFNRFQLTLNGNWQPAASNPATIRFPNYFGAQRFGRFDQQQLSDPVSWVASARPDAFSQVQSFFFNEYLRWRITHDRGRPQDGDVFGFPNSKKTFVDALSDELMARWQQGEIIISGPMFGTKMPTPNHQCESDFLAQFNLTNEHFARKGKRGRGTRRLLFADTWNFEVETREKTTILRFRLRSGCYATTLLLHLLDPERLNRPFWEWPDFTQGFNFPSA